MLERRTEAGGNILDREVDGINVHLYGAHIFHTDRYKALATAKYPNLALGGRLGEYRYYDMDEVVERVMSY